MAINTGKDYVIGKGRLFLALMARGTKTVMDGERYLGNSPEFSLTIAQDTLDHIDADQGLNVKDDQVTISNDMTGAFKLDSIDFPNVAMFFGGDLEKLTVPSATDIVDPDFTAKRGRAYQLGTSEVTPSGTRKVTNVVVSKVTPGAQPADPEVVTAVALANNVDVDLELGRIYIEADAPDIADGDKLRVTYDQEAIVRELAIAKGEEVRGALRFISYNPHGPDKDYYAPYVKITSNGDYALKGDSWQEMTFNFEVLKRDDTVERLYIDGRPS